MGKWGAAMLAACAGAALCACGGSEDSRTDGVRGADWTLTIVSPKHGTLQRGKAIVNVAVTGPAAARGQVPDFDIGYFVDGELVYRSHEPHAELPLERGSYELRVDGIDHDGLVLPRVVGDEVSIEVGTPLQRVGVDIPTDFPPIRSRRPDVQVQTPTAPAGELPALPRTPQL